MDVQLYHDSVEVNVCPLPNAVITGPHVICDSGCIVLSAQLGFNFNYQWFDANGDTIQFAIGSNYQVCTNNFQDSVYVVITDANGCSAVSPWWVIDTLSSPTVVINVISGNLCEGSPTLLNAVATPLPTLPSCGYRQYFGIHHCHSGRHLHRLCYRYDIGMQRWRQYCDQPTSWFLWIAHRMLWDMQPRYTLWSSGHECLSMEFQWDPHTRRNHAMSGDNPKWKLFIDSHQHIWLHCNFRYPNSGCSAVLRLNRYRSFSWSSWPYTWWLLLFNFSRKQSGLPYLSAGMDNTGQYFYYLGQYCYWLDANRIYSFFIYIRQQHLRKSVANREKIII